MAIGCHDEAPKWTQTLQFSHFPSYLENKRNECLTLLGFLRAGVGVGKLHSPTVYGLQVGRTLTKMSYNSMLFGIWAVERGSELQCWEGWRESKAIAHFISTLSHTESCGMVGSAVCLLRKCSRYIIGCVSSHLHHACMCQTHSQVLMAYFKLKTSLEGRHELLYCTSEEAEALRN